jgi:hypothetical protein
MLEQKGNKNLLVDFLYIQIEHLLYVASQKYNNIISYLETNIVDFVKFKLKKMK